MDSVYACGCGLVGVGVGRDSHRRCYHVEFMHEGLEGLGMIDLSEGELRECLCVCVCVCVYVSLSMYVCMDGCMSVCLSRGR
jgi:hypothetical protein